MNVSNIVGSLSSYFHSVSSSHHQGSQDFKALATALQSGDLSGAQAAFAALQSKFPNGAQGSTNPSGQANTPSIISQDFQSLQKALQSNDITGAQQAFATLRQDLHSMRRSREVKEGNDGDADDAGNVNSTQKTSVSRSQFAKDFQTLQSALQSGDMSSARQAFALFQQDLQSLQQHHHRSLQARDAPQASAAVGSSSQSTTSSSLNTLA